jgi:hypothetical protein
MNTIQSQIWDTGLSEPLKLQEEAIRQKLEERKAQE